MTESQERSDEAADAERAVERICDDETLRGDLEDVAYGGLLQRIVELAVQRAPQFASTDALYLALRQLLTGAVEAAERADREAVLAAATALLAASEVAEVCAALPPLLTGRADENALTIAGVLATVTGLDAAENRG